MNRLLVHLGITWQWEQELASGGNRIARKGFVDKDALI